MNKVHQGCSPDKRTPFVRVMDTYSYEDIQAQAKVSTDKRLIEYAAKRKS